MPVQGKWLKSYIKCEWPSDETWLMQKENMRLLNYVKNEFFAQKWKCLKKPLKCCILIYFGYHMVNIGLFIQYADFQRYGGRVSLKKHAFYKI